MGELKALNDKKDPLESGHRSARNNPPARIKPQIAEAPNSAPYIEGVASKRCYVATHQAMEVRILAPKHQKGGCSPGVGRGNQ